MKKFALYILIFVGKLALAQQLQIDLLKDFKGHSSKVTCLDFFANEQQIVSGDEGGVVFVWSTKAKQKKKLKFHDAQMVDVKVFNQQSQIVTADVSGKVAVWDAISLKQEDNFDFSKKAKVGFQLAFLTVDSNNVLYVGSKNGELFRKDLKTKEDPKLIVDIKSKIAHGSLAPDGKHLVFADGRHLMFYNITRQHVVRSMHSKDKEGIVHFSFNNAKNNVVIWTESGSIEVLNPKVGSIKRVKNQGLGIGGKVAYSAKDDFIISGNHNNEFRVFRSENMKQEIKVNRHKGTVTNFQFSKNQTYFATASADETVKVWKTLEGEENELSDNGRYSFSRNRDTIVAINDRPVVANQKVVFRQPHITLQIKDNRYVDGDTASIFINRDLLADDLPLTKTFKDLSYTMQKGKTYRLILFAQNLGKNPPNTAEVIISDGLTTRTVILSSDLKKSGAVEIKVE